MKCLYIFFTYYEAPTLQIGLHFRVGTLGHAEIHMGHATWHIHFIYLIFWRGGGDTSATWHGHLGTWLGHTWGHGGLDL